MNFRIALKSSCRRNVVYSMQLDRQVTATEKALEPMSVLVHEMSHSPYAAGRKRTRPSSSDTGVTKSEMYSGAVPATTVCMTQSLYMMR